jgi:hypothetical protein
MANQTSPSWIETVAKVVGTAIPPVGALEALVSDIRARRAARASEFLERISKASNEQDFVRRLDKDPRLEALFVAAVESAIRSSVDSKRNLLARVSIEAINYSNFDESELIIDALTQLDVLPIQALGALADEWDEVCRHPTDASLFGVSAVWGTIPTPIKALLIRTGTANSSPSIRTKQAQPYRAGGISDFGLSLINQLREEGWGR